ncbi:MAG: condensation domain-containing protein, partial [Planctomycetota bacterium]
MDDFIKRIGDLPLEKRALLEKRLLERLSAAKAPAGIPKRETEGPLPLSFAQRRLWFFSQLDPESTTYNEPSALRLKGALDIAALERALGEILRRHEALRASFFVIDGQPFQRVDDVSDFRVPVRDLSGVEESARETEARRVTEDIARRPFDLTAGILLRAELLHLDRDDHLLVLVIHHIASDGWSINVLYRELTLLYEALSEGRPSPLEELPVQYGDFALWQREKLSDEALAADFAYWEKHLEGATVLELPYDGARPAVQTFEGAHYTFKLADGLGARLDEFTRQSGATKFMVLLAAYAALLQRYTAREDMVLGAPIANRNRVELEGLIGFFANTLALRLDLSGDPTFTELVGRTREVAMGAYSHQDMPFERLVEHLHPDRHLSHLPLVQVVFTFQNVPRHQLPLPGLEVERFDMESGTAKFDLVL